MPGLRAQRAHGSHTLIVSPPPRGPEDTRLTRLSVTSSPLYPPQMAVQSGVFSFAPRGKEALGVTGPGISPPHQALHAPYTGAPQGGTEKELASTLRGIVPQEKEQALALKIPPYCQWVSRRGHPCKTAPPWHNLSLPGSAPQTGRRWRLPCPSGRGSFLVAPVERASVSETGGPWPWETGKQGQKPRA